MRQLTLRIDDELADHLKAVAGDRGESVNAYAGAVLRAAVDPDLAGEADARLRERLARSGLLAQPGTGDRSRPDPEAVRRARARAGRGRSLAELVSEDRT